MPDSRVGRGVIVWVGVDAGVTVLGIIVGSGSLVGVFVISGAGRIPQEKTLRLKVR